MVLANGRQLLGLLQQFFIESQSNRVAIPGLIDRLDQRWLPPGTDLL
jgi:hypothetical protein